MRSSSARRLSIFTLLAACPLASSAAELVPVSPAAAERLLERSAEVTSEFQQLIARAGDSGSENLATLADTNSPDWRLYYRDRQILFAVPSSRNLTAAQKQVGERDAAKLAAVMLQQQFQQALKLKAGTGLERESVRVVFIEPAAHQIAAGGWSGSGLGLSSSAYGSCGFAGVHSGFAGVPRPFAPAGFWPAGGGYQGGCGCR
jgi:hypothetical protein